jgi:catechol 2,3-dioxygenase-like lactoylglutathione lyase family enzyme
MKRLALLLIIFCCASAVAQDQSRRPKIVGIGSVRLSLSTSDDFVRFYINDLGFSGGLTVCNGASKACAEVNKFQRIDVTAPVRTSLNQLPEKTGVLTGIDFESTDVAQLRRYLIAHGMHPGDIVETPRSNLYFSTVDPEGHSIGFIQYLSQDNFSHPENQVSNHLIHAGFVVRDRAAEDKFYKDILGFHVYWHGGMKDGEDNWVDMQVPDGADWIEYMLNVSPNASHKTLGVMNHIALGVPDIHLAEQRLIKNGWKPTEEPKIGRDGKWQLNLYDPDETRVELMEFTPTQKPCCSDYTGPHPGQNP